MLDENIKSLAQAKNFAAFTTLLPGGQPMTHVMWVDADDEHILINTEVDRQKARNVKQGSAGRRHHHRCRRTPTTTARSGAGSWNR